MEVAKATVGQFSNALSFKRMLKTQELFHTHTDALIVLRAFQLLFIDPKIQLYSNALDIESLDSGGFIFDDNDQNSEIFNINYLIDNYIDIEKKLQSQGYRISYLALRQPVAIKMHSYTHIDLHYSSDDSNYLLPLDQGEYGNFIEDLDGSAEVNHTYIEFCNPSIDANSEIRVSTQSDMIFSNLPMSQYIEDMSQMLINRNWYSSGIIPG